MAKTYNKQWKSFGETVRSSHTIVRLVLLIIIVFTASVAASALATWKEPLSSPLTELSTFKFLRTSLLPTKENKMVYGFLPYWNLHDAVIHDPLTRIGYFSLAIAADGSLSKQTVDTEPGYAKLKSDDFLTLSETLAENEIPMDIVLTQFNATTIETFLASKEAQETLFAELDSLLLAYPFNGINVDIEYASTPSAELRDDLSIFMHRLNMHLDEKYEDIELSIDVFASAAKDTQIWDLRAITPSVDYFIIMAYDFHHRSSTTAGPVAPLFSEPNLSSDISTFLKLFLEKIPNDKLVLGVPFYGYEWQTTSRESRSFTYPGTGSAATYERVQELLTRQSELSVQRHWDDTALAPYLSYTEDGETYIVYYEDVRSLSFKFDFVNQLNLRGIAIWALGYEGTDTTLWDSIDEKL